MRWWNPIPYDRKKCLSFSKIEGSAPFQTYCSLLLPPPYTGIERLQRRKRRKKQIQRSENWRTRPSLSTAVPHQRRPRRERKEITSSRRPQKSLLMASSERLPLSMQFDTETGRHIVQGASSRICLQRSRPNFETFSPCLPTSVPLPRTKSTETIPASRSPRRR